MAGWKQQIEALPDACAHADCGAPRSCRQRIAEYLRMQWNIAKRLERITAAKSARAAAQ
ncbi:MAG TPA: hypothetical protein VFY12_11095 [Arenimonas sp.]|nr:hypothetical protein [Arenimonas sp.]